MEEELRCSAANRLPLPMPYHESLSNAGRFFDLVGTTDRVAVEVAMKEYGAVRLMLDGTGGVADHCIIHVMNVRQQPAAPVSLGVKHGRSIE